MASPPLTPPDLAAAADIGQLLTIKDVATLLRTTRQAVGLWVRRGRFPSPITVGPRKRLWRASAVRAWLQEREGAVNAAQANG